MLQFNKLILEVTIKKSIIILFFTLIFLVLSIYLLNNKSTSLKNIPHGDFISQTESLNHAYTVKFYLINTHATVDFSIRGKLIDNKSGNTQNIYWAYHESTVSSKWIDNNTIEINSKTLNVKKDTYDWRCN